MLLGNTVDALTLHPLVMLIEDDEKKIMLKKKAFKNRGCNVIAFTHSDEAIKNIFTSPSLDLILTDIDLDGSGHDKSGVAFARFVKELHLDVPLCGYSSQFEDDQLSDEEKSHFDCWYDKAQLANEINQMLDDLKSMAVIHRKEKYEETEKLISHLRKKYTIKTEDYEQIRELILKTDGPSELEKILHDANYSLRILHPVNIESISNPILIWIKTYEDTIEAEVYGHSSLYSFGETEDIEIEKLVELMQLFAQDVINADSDNYQGAALKLKDFLSYAFKHAG
jgi:CheY-like chemotaxis protein